MVDREEIAMRYRIQLAELLAKKGFVPHPGIRQAFADVPRHTFIESYYLPDRTNLYYTQIFQPQPGDREEDWRVWLRMIYSNSALITRADARGFPTSSSSMPGFMAQMLSALQLKRDQTVLEIGTATGYNAAILAHLVRDPSLLTTIDIDPELVANAKRHLEESVGPGIQAIAANALTWQAPQTYDRILATASWPTIPLNWLEQLHDHGILVMELTSAFGSFLIQVHKGEKIQVSVVPGWNGRFMQMRSLPEDDVHHAPIQRGTVIARYTVPVNQCSYETIKIPGLAILLQSRFPHLHLRRQHTSDTQMMYLIDEDRQAMAAFHRQQHECHWQIECLGSDIWAEYLAIEEQWRSYGKPRTLETYLYHIDERGILMASRP